jgi:hypothetical protein
VIKRALLVLGVSVAVAGCSTPPKQHAFENTWTVNNNKDKVWEKAVGFLAMNNISVKAIEKDSGIIYAETTRFDPSMVADCGDDPLLQVVDSKAEFNVFVRPVDAGTTTVAVNTDFTVVKQFGNNPPIQQACTSRGVLERAILQAVAK